MKQTVHLQHEKMSQVLKTEQVRRPSPRQPVLANQWDSVESDTESMAHERAHQQGDDNACNDDDEAEDHKVYDSLDAAAPPRANRTPAVLQTEYWDIQMDEREGTSTDDNYSDLRYDPNWRTNLRGADCFNTSPHVPVEDYYQVPKEKTGPACSDSQGPVMKAEYRYIVNTSPAVVVTADMAGNEPEQPYRLHPQDVQTSAVTSPHSHNNALQLQSPEADHSKASCSVTKNEGDKSLVMGFREKCESSCDNAGENPCRSPELTQDMLSGHAMYIQEFKTVFLQEPRGTHGGPLVLSNKMSEDIVERNKTTLGRKTSKWGSYASVHGCKQEIPHNINKVHATPSETARTESQKDSSDPEPETQQLRVTKISEKKKAQRKEYHNPPPTGQQPPAPGVKAEWGDCLSSPLAGIATVTQSKPQKTTPSQPLLSTIHLNIKLNTSSHLLPLIQQRSQDDIITLASLHGSPHWRPASEDELALSPGCQQTNPGRSSQMSWRGLNVHLHHRDLESCSEQQQRTTALKWPIICEGEGQDCQCEVHTREFPQSLPRTPTRNLSLGSGSYPVLPAIEKSMTGKEPELSPGVNRSSSNGNLVQMEKQKQLRARVTYKAYSLKNYKQLESDINLRGLGPDYTAIEETKLKRQKLYSNVIREQNKKISRIPFLLAKDPEGNDKKVPRMKALEYARTIAKPPVQSQAQQRQKHRSKGFTEHTSDLDISQLATLEVLRKRHEEEKQAVALFRKVHAD